MTKDYVIRALTPADEDIVWSILEEEAHLREERYEEGVENRTSLIRYGKDWNGSGLLGTQGWYWTLNFLSGRRGVLGRR